MNEKDPPLIKEIVTLPEIPDGLTEAQHFEALRKAYDTVDDMQDKFDRKVWNTYGGALSLQNAQERLKEHKRAIKGPKLVWVNPNPPIEEE